MIRTRERKEDAACVFFLKKTYSLEEETYGSTHFAKVGAVCRGVDQAYRARHACEDRGETKMCSM